ncbi:MAG: hypothetical protein ACLSHO_12505 [Dysosmobacter sp.]
MDSKTLQTLRRDAEDICRSAIEASVPDAAIQRALAQLPPVRGGRCWSPSAKPGGRPQKPLTTRWAAPSNRAWW